MTLEEILKQLEESGTEQNRKVYAKHGVTGEMFGVSYANLASLAKKIKKDHELAVKLWRTKNHDGQILATMIADPEQMDTKQIDEWAKDLSNYVITDAFSKLVKQTDSAKEKAENWTNIDDEWLGAIGWQILSAMTTNEALPDEYFVPFLKTIETDIHKRKNRVRYAMNGALISIGARNENLEKEALRVAAQIGKVEVNHGATNCQTPDAAAYILKMKERNKKVQGA